MVAREERQGERGDGGGGGEERRGEERRGEVTDIKSNNPHLTGGKKTVGKRGEHFQPAVAPKMRSEKNLTKKIKEWKNRTKFLQTSLRYCKERL